MWENISYVNRSKVRKIVLGKILKPSTPTRLAKELHMHRPAVSLALIGMQKKGLVECLNPMSKRERYYQATRSGIGIKKEIEKMLE